MVIGHIKIQILTLAENPLRPGVFFEKLPDKPFSHVHLQMERETLRRQAEEARRCGAIESINGVPLDSDGTKPIFGPPVKIRNRDDSLHRKLQKCLGNFDDVSGYLFKDMHYSGRGMELSIGLDSGLVRTGGRSRSNGHSNGTMATKSHTSRRIKNNVCHRSGVASASSARRRHASAFEKDLHVKHGGHSANLEQQVASGTNSPSEPPLPPLPLEVATLIKEMREMIATPLTGISTPKQDGIFDYDAKVRFSYTERIVFVTVTRNHRLNKHSDSPKAWTFASSCINISSFSS
ncbi:hypothetical protein D918_06930 [Trichuris suis]|nr:hypothetical protein D918_06930 [Trichuris suis]